MKLFTKCVKEITRQKFAKMEMVSFTPRNCTLKDLGPGYMPGCFILLQCHRYLLRLMNYQDLFL